MGSDAFGLGRLSNYLGMLPGGDAFGLLSGREAFGILLGSFVVKMVLGGLGGTDSEGRRIDARDIRRDTKEPQKAKFSIEHIIKTKTSSETNY